MENLLFLLKGLLIGLIVGFPSGPVGFIYIKRAATDGFLAGFISGIGSTLAHLFYVFIFLFGYSKILKIYNESGDILTFVFSSFVIILGIIIFCSNKKKNCEKEDPETLYGYLLSAFGITVTNPVEIIQFTFLFTFLGIFQAVSINHTLLILGIILGSIFWPIIISFGLSKIRHSIPNKNIEYLQKVVGVIIIFIGLFFILKNFT